MLVELELEQLIACCLPFRASVGVVRAERGSLPPEEAAALPASWSEKRAREHWAGRQAAARALARYGRSDRIGRADDGVPLFPQDFVGSIAHTGGRSVVGLCIASEEARAVGIDIEGRQSLAPELIERIVDSDEKTFLAGFAADLGTVTLWAFCAKEAYYKCVFPSHRRFLGFHEVSFSCDPSPPNSAHFGCLLGEKALGDSLSGRIILADEFVVSVVWRT